MKSIETKSWEQLIAKIDKWVKQADGDEIILSDDASTDKNCFYVPKYAFAALIDKAKVGLLFKNLVERSK
jgi:hypothetical protein